MKNITKKIAAILLVCVMALSVVSLVACTDKNVYTVKVVDVDGNPYTKALVQVCKIGDLCYPGVATDAQGVAKLEIGKEIPDEDVNEVEVHLQGLPVYLTHDPVTMRKGETITVVVKQVEPSTPASGTGEGHWETDFLGNERLTMDPYVVEEGVYGLKFTSATQKIYYEFHAWEEGVYKVYSVGSVDASVTQLLGAGHTGIHHPGDDPDFTNDNVSATDKNFSYEFVVDPDLFEQSNAGSDINYAICYFEVSLSNASDVNKDALIVFEYVGEYEPAPEIEEVDVYPAKTLTVYDGQGDYVDLDVIDDYVKGADGYYHLNTDEGPIIVATLGNDTVAPNFLEMSFYNIYLQGQLLSFYDSEQNKILNYAPLVEAYTQACNDEGRYPLTDELIDFFNLYVANVCGKDFASEKLNSYVPEGKEWLIWCGFYQEAHVADGTEYDPFPLEIGDNVTITVPDSGSVYYFVATDDTMSYIIMSDDTNIKLAVYNMFMGPMNADVMESDDSGFYYETTVEGRYIFQFSTKNGVPGSYSVRIMAEVIGGGDEEGTEDNPKEISYMGEYYDEVEAYGAVWYAYEVTSATKLYFAVDSNTTITVSYTNSQGETLTFEYSELADGLEVEAGVVVKVMVSTKNDAAGEVCFTIDTKPITE